MRNDLPQGNDQIIGRIHQTFVYLNINGIIDESVGNLPDERTGHLPQSHHISTPVMYQESLPGNVGPEHFGDFLIGHGHMGAQSRHDIHLAGRRKQFIVQICQLSRAGMKPGKIGRQQQDLLKRPPVLFPVSDQGFGKGFLQDTVRQAPVILSDYFNHNQCTTFPDAIWISGPPKKLFVRILDLFFFKAAWQLFRPPIVSAWYVSAYKDYSTDGYYGQKFHSFSFTKTFITGQAGSA